MGEEKGLLERGAGRDIEERGAMNVRGTRYNDTREEHGGGKGGEV